MVATDDCAVLASTSATRLPPGRTARASVAAASTAVVVLCTTMSFATKQWVTSTVKSHTCWVPAAPIAVTSSHATSPSRHGS
jgi:hypothetical protein